MESLNLPPLDMECFDTVKVETERQNELYVLLHYAQFLLKVVFTVTGPLKEKQIAYVCRETLQVSTPSNLTPQY